MSHLVKIQALFLSSFLLMFGGGLHGLLLAVRGAQEGFSTLALGLIGTGWSAGFIAGSILVPMLVNRVGHIRSYAVMAAIGAITILLNLLWINEIGWIVMRVFSGFCFAGAAMVVESWLNERAENSSRGTLFSTYVVVNLSASTLGQLAISVMGVAGMVPFVVGAIAIIGAMLPTALSTQPQPTPIAATRINLPLLYKTSPVAVVASFGVGVANGTFGTLAPVFAFLKGIPAHEIGYLMSVPIILGAVGQLPLGRLSDHVDRRLVIVGAGLLAALTGLVILFTGASGWLLTVLFGIYGLSAYPIYAVAVAHANDFAERDQFSAIASGMLLTFGVGLAIGPLVAAFVMGPLGPGGLFAVTAFMHGVIAISAYIRMQLRRAEPREPFRPLPLPLGKNTTSATSVLDPRANPEEGDEIRV